MYHRSAAAATLLLLLLGPRTPLAALDLRRQYEDELVRWALGVAHLELDPDPRGKIIERIEIVREDIIARTDPWPRFLNWVHVTTRDHVVRQELLVRPGQRWDQELIDESARNLRKLPVLAVVRTAACRSPQPGKVVLLVVTKDLWSIRLNMQFDVVGSVVHAFSFNPTEMNFLGRNKRMGLHVGLNELDLGPFKVRDSIDLGQIYVDQRLLGSRLQLIEQFNAVIAGDLLTGGRTPTGERWSPSARAGQLEGVYARLRLTRPLFSLATRWSFDAYGIADVRQVRRYVVNGSSPPEGEDAGLSLDTVAVHSGNTTSHVPWVYDARALTGLASLTRSFGRAIKHGITSTVSAYSYRYTAPAGSPFDPAVLQTYLQGSVPRSEEAAYYGIGYYTYEPRFAQLRNIQTFALTEDFVLGHEVALDLSFGTNLRDPVQGFLDAQLRASYVWLRGEDLLTVWTNARTRWQPRLDLPGHAAPWANSRLAVGVHNISPRLWIGRLHARARVVLRDNDLRNTTSVLGGGGDFDNDLDNNDKLRGDTLTSFKYGPLRGYGSGQFQAPNAFLVNVEYRSLPINLFTLHFGLVVFYDGGAVWGPDPRTLDTRDPGTPRSETVLPFRYHQSVGLGLRTHFPQFDRASLRVDFGVPLSGAAGSVGTWFSFAFSQVF